MKVPSSSFGWLAASLLLTATTSACKPLKAGSCMRQSDCNQGLMCQSGQCVAPPSTGEASTGLRSDAPASASGTGAGDAAGATTSETPEVSAPPSGLVGGG